MPRSKSSKRWLQEHKSDPYVKQAQLQGYRSRAVFKLKEIHEKVKLFKPGMTIVDLGAAPGGWSQYVSQILKNNCKIIALDLLPMEPIEGVTFIQGDFTEDEVLDRINAILPEKSVDIVLSDMAPNMTGVSAVDIPRAMYLCELALEFCESILKKEGSLFLKIFHGEGFDQFVKHVRKKFKHVKISKPEASRGRSRETYLLARGYNL